MFQGLITIEQFIISAILALIITRVILYISKNRASFENSYPVKEIEQILNRCYTLFPTESLKIDGNTIKRGMIIRIVTNQNKTFEGKFLGSNDDKMLCLMTKKFIVAHAIQNIEYIEEIE